MADTRQPHDLSGGEQFVTDGCLGVALYICLGYKRRNTTCGLGEEPILAYQEQQCVSNRAQHNTAIHMECLYACAGLHSVRKASGSPVASHLISIQSCVRYTCENTHTADRGRHSSNVYAYIQFDLVHMYVCAGTHSAACQGG